MNSFLTGDINSFSNSKYSKVFIFPLDLPHLLLLSLLSNMSFNSSSVEVVVMIQKGHGLSGRDSDGENSINVIIMIDKIIFLNDVGRSLKNQNGLGSYASIGSSSYTPTTHVTTPAPTTTSSPMIQIFMVDLN